MRRFLVSPDCIGNGCATITGDLFRHMVKVLRLKSGTPIILADGNGHEYAGIIDKVGREAAIVTFGEARIVAVAPAGPRFTLYQGLPKGDKLELILQKATELGVSGIVPFAASRSVVRLRKEDIPQKTERWQRIAREAARQSGRSSVPFVATVADTAAAVDRAEESVKLLLWEEEKVNRLKDVLAQVGVPASVGVMVGPEGGLTIEEGRLAIGRGFIPVSLGHRILRTETVALAILSILQFHWGDMG